MANYPQQVTQDWLDTQLKPGERIVRIELHGCFNYRPVPMQGRTNKSYLFVYDPKATRHVLKVPEHLWMAGNGFMAEDLMLSRNNSYNLVALVVEQVAKEAPAPAPLPKAKPAVTRKKSAEDAAMAVLAG